MAALAGAERRLHRMLQDLAPDAQGGGEEDGGGEGEGGERAQPLNFTELLRILEVAGVGDDPAARGDSGPEAQPSMVALPHASSSAPEGSPSANSPMGEGGAGDVEGEAL